MIQLEGALGTGDYEVVEELIRKWLGQPKVKIRTFGEEFVYQDETIYVYIQHAMIDTIPRDEFLVSGQYNGDLGEAGATLDRLSELCREQGIALELGYGQVDSAGNPIGEEMEIEVEAE